jgi:hypothetical protein
LYPDIAWIIGRSFCVVKYVTAVTLNATSFDCGHGGAGGLLTIVGGVVSCNGGDLGDEKQGLTFAIGQIQKRGFWIGVKSQRRGIRQPTIG